MAVSTARGGSKKSASSLKEDDSLRVKDNPITCFECPPNFQEVEISSDGEPLYLEDIQGSAELWLIKAPLDFDAKKLDGTKASLSGRQFLDETEDTEISYELHASQNTMSDIGLPHLLLPSRKGDQSEIVPAPAFTGKLAVVESVDIPLVLLPPTPPKRSNELPPGLKQRFMPFGWEDPKKCELNFKKSSDASDSSVQKTKAKKSKKSHKHKESGKSKSLRSSSSMEADSDVRHGDTESEERLPPGGVEEAVDGDEGDERGDKKEHRKGKKRKHPYDHGDKKEDVEAQATAEEATPQKKKKKKHKNTTG